jgi:geranylgeranyl transferase type-2 subunit alpha
MLNGIFPDSSAEEVNNLLATELSMTTAALKAHPKVYWVWNHRRWCLENIPDGPGQEGADIYGWKKANWDRELFVVEKMLDADPRNCAWHQSASLEV